MYVCVKYVALIWEADKLEIHGIDRQARKSSQNWHCRLASKGNLEAEFSFSYKTSVYFLSRLSTDWTKSTYICLLYQILLI